MCLRHTFFFLWPKRRYFWLFWAIFSIPRAGAIFFLPLKHVLKKLSVRVGGFFGAVWRENLLATLGVISPIL